MNAAELAPFVTALAAALWLGLLTAISPCPLATNIAAIGYVARFSQAGGRGRTWLPGLLYSLGRALAYTVVGGIITWGLLSAPSLSSFLQEHMNQLLGPLLVLVGMALLGMLPGLPSFGKGGGAGLNDKLMSLGLMGCVLMGFIFALAVSREAAGRAFQHLQSTQRWITPISGWLLIAIGVWMCLHLTLRSF